MTDSMKRGDTTLGATRVQVHPVGAFPPSRRRFPWRGVALFLVAGAGGAGGVLLWQSRNALPPVLVVTTTAPTLQEKEKLIELETVAARQREKIAVAKAKLQEILDDGEKTLGLLPLFDTEASAWDTNVASLLADDRGRYLAADETYITAFKTLWNQKRPSNSDRDAVRRRVETLLEPVRIALASENAAYAPSEDFLSKLQHERKAVQTLIAAYHEPRMQIEGLVAQASKAKTPAAMTLQDAIRDLDARQAGEQASKIAAAKEAERKKADDAVAAAKAAQVAQEAKDQVARTEAERDAAQKRAEIEKQSLRDTVEREQKNKLAASDEVGRLLRPFLAEGYWQPAKRPEEWLQKGPVSFSGLQTIGALEDTPRGLQQLLTAGTKPPNSAPPPDKVRPRWGYPYHLRSLSPAQIEELKTAQRFLRELGPTMVELKMLSP